TSSDIRIFAASSVVLESFYLYKHPFYEFFKIERLKGLDTKQTQQLLSKLGEVHGRKEVKRIVDHQPGRIESLCRLTGGVIRTIILLFEIFIDNDEGTAFTDLENVLDRVTPLYKHRMDDLPASQQQIVEAIALSWDAVSVKTISEMTRMESKVISAQLNQLVKNEVVHKIKTNTKNHLYQITERFFNIWYLMRHGRNGDRQRVQWLMRFLEDWCDTNELIERANKHVKGLQKGNYNQRAAYLFSEAIASTRHLPKEEQHELLQSTRSFLSENNSRYLQQLSRSDIELQQQSRQAFRSGQYQIAINYLLKMRAKDFFQIGYIYQKRLRDFKLAENYYKKAAGKGHVAAMNNLGILYEYHLQAPDQAKQMYDLASQNNNSKATYNLALLHKKHYQNYKQAEQYYLLAIQQGAKDAHFNLANLYANELKQPKQAITYYQKASEQGHLQAMSNLAYLYVEIEKDYDEASYYFKKVLEDGLLYNADFLDISEDHPLHFHFLFLLAKEEYDFLNRCFHSAKAQQLQLMDRLKPLYYSLMHFQQNQFPNAFLKMGNELKETVEEIIREVQWMRKVFQ
ncbi:MAG: tetratricopeptide repeat protein, partial [Bacteroidota bacterium]